MINHRMLFLVYFHIPLLKIELPLYLCRYLHIKRKALPGRSPIMANTAIWPFRTEKTGTKDFGRLDKVLLNSDGIT